MKPILTHVSNFFANLAELPKTMTQNTLNAIAPAVAEKVAGMIKDEIVETLEKEGYDVNLSINIHIKKH